MRKSAYYYAVMPTWLGRVRKRFLDRKVQRRGMPVTQKRKVTVLLEPEEFERFERYCEDRGFKKSTLVARLIREHLDKERFDRQRQLPFNESDHGQE